MAKNGVQNVKIGKIISGPCFPHNGPQMVEISKKNSEKKSLLEPSEVGWGMAKNEVFGHFCQFFWSNPMEINNGTRKCQKNFLAQWSGQGGSKMAIFFSQKWFFSLILAIFGCKIKLQQ